MINSSRYNIYQNKDGRFIAYDKITKRNKSYPRIIMEDFLQRPLLETEEVHHIDGNPQNNDISNLKVLTRKDHKKVHGDKKRKYYNKEMTCPTCGKIFVWTIEQQKCFKKNENTTKRKGTKKSGPFCSRRCSGIYSSYKQYNISKDIEAPKPIQKTCPICKKEFTWSVASQRAYKKGIIKLQEACCSLSCIHALRKKSDEYIAFANMIYETMQNNGGNVIKTARLLGISRGSVIRHLKSQNYPYKQAQYK